MDKINCYDYALGNANPNQTRFSQPIVRRSETHQYTCPSVEAGMLKQHPDISVTTFEKTCPVGKRKIALVVDDLHPSDYHFYRQDSDGYWSHKPGYKAPRRYDGSGRRIIAPHTSDRDFDSFNYTNMCNYYCVPGDMNAAK